VPTSFRSPGGEERLRELTAELETAHAIRAYVVPADLSIENVAERIRRATDELALRIDVLVNNAGFGTFGCYETIDPARCPSSIFAYLPSGMVRAADGVVINVASGASFQPMPYQAVYGAVKAFLLSFNDALWAENRSRGVRFVACCPADTETEYFDVLGNHREVMYGKPRPAEDVVKGTLRALDRGRPVESIGVRWKLTAALYRFLPRSATAKVSEVAGRPKDLTRTADRSPRNRFEGSGGIPRVTHRNVGRSCERASGVRGVFSKGLADWIDVEHFENHRLGTKVSSHVDVVGATWFNDSVAR
jgi:uncharacterized protein